MAGNVIEWVRERLSSTSVVPYGDLSGNETGTEAKRADNRPIPTKLTQAAVLIPLVMRQNELSILLTRRADHLYHHPGQISFPGGRIEDYDESVEQAALRETAEEIGLASEHIELLGMLPSYVTITGFHVFPVVGIIYSPFELKLDAFEVAEAFEVPWTFLLDEANYQKHRIERDGAVRYFEAVPYAGRFIWGATAGMLSMLRHCIDSG